MKEGTSQKRLHHLGLVFYLFLDSEDIIKQVVKMHEGSNVFFIECDDMHFVNIEHFCPKTHLFVQETLQHAVAH